MIPDLKAKRVFKEYFLSGCCIVRVFKIIQKLNQIDMFRHNFILTYRSIKRYKSSFLINLIGLSTGLACTLLIYLWVNAELSVDKFLEKDDQLFQVLQNVQRTNGIETIEATPGLLAKALADEMPEVEYSVTVVPTTFNASKGVVSTDDAKIKSIGQYVSNDFFNAFSYKLIYGDRAQVLSEKNNVVVSKELALKLFKSIESAVGQTIDWETREISGLCIISGIFESLPSNSTTQFDLLLTYDWFEETNPFTGWGNNSPYSFVLLQKGISPDQFNRKIKGFIKAKDENLDATLFLQQYSDRYLFGQYENGLVVGGRIQYIRLFIIIAIFILVIACINFTNLFTAKASRRIKEIGIKKAMGVSRKVLISQYLQESIFMAFLSLLMAILLVVLFLPQFNEITGKHFTINFDVNAVLTVLSITFFTGLLSGGYPAFYLSGFNPGMVLKGLINTSQGVLWARKGLIVFQFTVAITLIVSVLVIYKQIGFIQFNKTLGYDREHVIYFDIEKMSTAFTSELENIPGVLNVGGGNITAGKSLGGTNGFSWKGKDPNNQTFFSMLWVSYNLIETLNIEMVDGRSFSKDFGSHNQIIFNETAIRNMGLKDPIGKTIKTGRGERRIVGVAKDFHFESLYEEVKPCALFLAPMEYAPRVSVKIQKEEVGATMDKIQKVYETYNPGLVFDFKFMNDDNQRLYASERRMAILSRYFAGITIIISCLGLFGLAAFTAERRIKEIVIRKILGASALNIVKMLSNDFTKMVIAAIVIALPLSYLMAKRWLESFVYRIDLEWWYFVGAGIVALLIAWLTVGFQTFKAANINPSNCLRDE